ncbi:hypothetical protein NBRC116188_15020 [Oceaniserpentilla sp. 4NH20-0058]|uniref:helix-turn-helix domain-containing protein n=1 Tax=Oceaniserpentilla sp. 4NH20-0058 TaxID=3127660 RepID=UPI0031080688
MVHTQETYPMAMFSSHLGKNTKLLLKAIDEYTQDVHINIRYVGCGMSLNGYIAGAETNEIQVSCFRYGIDVEVHCLQDNVFCFVIPLAGKASIQINPYSEPLVGHEVFFIPPNVELNMKYSAECGHIILRLPANDYHNQVFSSIMRRNSVLSLEQVQSIRGAIQNFVYACTFCKDMFSALELLKKVRLDIIDSIQNDNSLKNASPYINNEKLERAVSYILANPEWEYDVDFLSQEAGVPKRTLYWLFNSELNITPYRFFIVCKLKNVRLDILKYGKSMTITEIAMKHSFIHLSRFASQYKILFGELPIETQGRCSKKSL